MPDTAAPAARVAGDAPGQAPAIPERPRLAPGVKLAGQMQESAFKEPPWLLERDGAGYVQVTELLYRIAEQSTGDHGYDAIAANLTDAGLPVRADTIQRLVAQMLIPLGLVAMADGSVAPVSKQRSSLLSINMRMKMVSPRLIEPVTRVFQALYWPPVLIAVLLAAVATQGWVFMAHGVGAGVRQALYEPGLLLLAVALSVASAGFHEVGHAAALRYAGARVKGMGAGLYLVYPAFYTDVSDNYRLRRWQRIRTDLGGFYFNLIFALAIFAADLLTRQEFLLVLIVLADFEIVYQLQPFMRLDGYWTLADLTGIPDFFSQLGAFWRSVLPLQHWRGQKLPELKWWGKVVFVLYTAITIPLLTLLLFLMVRAVPRVLATAGDSLVKLAAQAATAAGHGEVLAIIAAAVQMAVLAVPTLGMLFILYVLGKRLFTGLWRWAAPSTARKPVAALGSAAAVLLVGYLWLSQLPAFLPRVGGRPGPLAASGAWRPLAPGERGTLGDAVRPLPIVNRVVAVSSPSHASSLAQPTATPQATRGTPVPTGTAAPRRGAAASPAAGPSTTPQSGQSPTPNATSATPATATAGVASGTPTRSQTRPAAANGTATAPATVPTSTAATPVPTSAATLSAATPSASTSPAPGAAAAPSATPARTATAPAASATATETAVPSATAASGGAATPTATASPTP